MLDVKSTIQSTLNNILPTQYELYLNNTTTFPCLSFLENINQSRSEGDTIRYSTIGFSIKLYTYSLDDIVQYAPLIDTVMKNLGFTRTSSVELVVNAQIIKTFYYECLALEN